MPARNPVIMWFRRDLRLADNPALAAAAEAGRVLPVFILDDDAAGKDAPGSASRWWLHHSLKALNRSLRNKLRLYQGDAVEIISALCDQHEVTSVFFNRAYESWQAKQDETLRKALDDIEIPVKTFNGRLLWEPWEILKGDDTPYRVFTPFYKNARQNGPAVGRPKPAPGKLQVYGEPCEDQPPRCSCATAATRLARSSQAALATG